MSSTPPPHLSGPGGPHVRRPGPGESGPERPRRSWRGRLILLAVLFVPILEIFALIAVGRSIGFWWTFALLLALSMLGVWLIGREGSATWKALRAAVETGRMPAKEVSDAVLVMAGGVLLLLPGFLTDIVGLVLILPFTRPLPRRLLQRSAERSVMTQAGVVRSVRVDTQEADPKGTAAPGTPTGTDGPADPGTAPPSGTVIEGTVTRHPGEGDGTTRRPRG